MVVLTLRTPADILPLRAADQLSPLPGSMVIAPVGQTVPVPRSVQMAPPPTFAGNRRVVAPDVESVRAEVRFDVTGREATGTATVDFLGGEGRGYPALDLRQEVDWVRLDGEELPASSFSHADLGAGWDARMRVLDVKIDGGSRHCLEVGYRLDTPDAHGAQPIDWTDDGVRFDFWMSDLYPGRYLEMWVPAPLIHDRFALTVDIVLDGTDRAHRVIANSPSVESDPTSTRWSISYPDHYTALSPMLVLAPADMLEVRRTVIAVTGRRDPLSVVTARHADTDADLGVCEADICSWLTYLACRYEPWAHGDTFWGVVWGPGRGMEYDGATTAAVGALEHEVFHSWFGRGVKPARASDGWIDEAYTTWSTASRHSELPRFSSIELSLDEPPVELYPPHAWSRHTAAEAYAEGSKLFAGIAHQFGGADRLRAAMADWYRSNVGTLVTTDGLGAHLKAWSGVDIGPWWARFVHGRD